MTSLFAWFRAEDKVSLLPLLAIGVLIIGVPIFLGGNGYEGESFLFLLTGLIAYFTWKSDTVAFSRALARPVSIIFLLFICAMALSLIPSADRFSSLTGLVNWVALYIVFISASVVATSERRRELLSTSVIVSATVLSVIGLYGLLHTSNFGYLRLTSTFDQHNAFGGFLLLPIALLFGRLCAAKTWKAFVIWGAMLVIIGSTFVLTFSRGSWVSLALGITVAIFVFRKRVWKLLKNTRLLTASLLVALAIAGALWGALRFTQQQATAENQTVGVFTGETVENNALTARLQYFRDALTVIKQNPIFGVGLRHYGEAVKLYKDTPAFYASSPHNEYLKFPAEIGVIGGILFGMLILLLLVRLFRSARRVVDADTWLAQAGLLAGGVAVCAHLGMEVDWGYVANPLLFFVLMSTLYSSEPQHDEAYLHEDSLLVRGITALVILVAVTVSLLGMGYWHQMYRTEQGVVLLHQNKLGDAFLELKEAYRFSDFNSSPHYFAALTLEQASHLTPDLAKQKSFLSQALTEMNRAIALKPKKPLFYSWQARIYQELGDESGSQRAFEMTVKYNPVEGIYEYEQLAILYNKKGAYGEVIALAGKVLPYYPLDMYANPYWVNPNKETAWKQVADIYTQLSIAYTKTGDTARAKEAKAKALLYSPSSVK